MPDLIRTDYPATDILRIRINRPEKRNAMDYDTRQALIEALQATQSDAQCRAIVFGGVDNTFSAGGDLPSMVNMSEQQARARMQHAAQACRLIASTKLPFVSAAEGFCAGAAVGLALLGDEIIVSQRSRILFPFLKLGLVPDWCLLRTLPARIGLTASRRILTAGKPVTGLEAAEIGLVDQCVADDQVMSVAIERARHLASLAPGAYARMKARFMNPSRSLEEELQREEEDQSIQFTGPDFREGYAAYTEKREPDFSASSGQKNS